MKIICFDFDNVIVDGNTVLRMVRKRKNYSKILRNLTKSYDPNNFTGFIYNVMRISRGMDFGEIRRAVLETRLMKGLKKTFKELRKKGFTIVVASTNDTRIIKGYLAKHKISGYVSQIYGSKMGVSGGKLTGTIKSEILDTKKIGILKIIEKKYKVKKKDIIYIGDGLTDLPVMERVERSVLFCPNLLARLKARRNKILRKKKKDGSFRMIRKKDMTKILGFVTQ